jgi:hypothetical protein
MGAVVPGPWRPSAIETEVEVLTKRIEVLERDRRRAIEIAEKAVEGSQDRADRAYQRGFRKGFDCALKETNPARHRLPFETAVDAGADGEQRDAPKAKGGLLR